MGTKGDKRIQGLRRRRGIRNLTHSVLLGVLLYEGIGLVHEPYVHLLSTNDRAHLATVQSALDHLPNTDYYSTPVSCYVPASRRAELVFALSDRRLLEDGNGAPVEFLDPGYLEWDGRHSDPDYLERVEIELEGIVKDYLGGTGVDIQIDVLSAGGLQAALRGKESNHG